MRSFKSSIFNLQSSIFLALMAAFAPRVEAEPAGGTITTNDGYTVHTFTSGDNFVVDQTIYNVGYLIVGGGGAGGDGWWGSAGGGGGGGGVVRNLAFPLASVAPGTYPVVVGTGGTGGANTSGNSGNPSSVFGTLGVAAAAGGGGGGANFITLGKPVVTVSAATGIGVGTATLNGTLVSTNGYPGTTFFFCWGTNDYGTASTTPWTVVNGGAATNGQSFSNNLTGLIHGLRYWYRAYATNSAGGAWSATTNFVTTAVLAFGPTTRITGVIATAGNNVYGDASKSVDWSGMSTPGPDKAATQNNNYGDMWTPQGGGQTTWIQFDFGNVYNLKEIFLWNYNQTSDRGVRTANIYYATTPVGHYKTGGTGWTLYAAGSSLEWPDTTGNGGDHSVVDMDNINIPCRYIEINVLTRWEDPSDGGGLSEILFYQREQLPASGITNTTATAVGTTQATLNGVLTGTNSFFDVYAYWGPTDGTNNPAAWTNSALVGGFTLSGATTSSNIAYTATAGIESGKTYWYTFLATNAATNIWASTSKSFTALGPPTVDNGPSGATGIGVGTATLNGRLLTQTADMYLVWGTNDCGNTSTGLWPNVASFGAKTAPASVSTNLTGLIYGLRYWYRAYATNSAGGAWSATTNFVTTAPALELTPVANNMVVWFDAGVGVTSDGGGVLTWNDRSGNAHHGTRASGSPTLVASVPAINNRPAIETRGNDDWLNLAGNMFAREHYIVFRSRPDRTTWSNYGGILGQSAGRTSNYLMENNTTYFHGNQYPDAVSRNGTALVSPFSLAPVEQYMVMKVVVNTGDTAQQAYQIGRADGYSPDIDVAEIIGYSTTLSAGDENTVGGYLTWKYGITTSYTYTLPVSAGITNTTATSVQTTQATLNGVLTGTNSFFDVYAYWGPTDGTNNPAAWTNSALVGGFTLSGATISSNIAYTAMSGIESGKVYWYAFRATNACTNIWATPSKAFITGEVTVQATDGTAQYPGNTAAFTIFRPETCTNAPLTVYYTMSGSAINGLDYSTLSGSVTMDAGATSAVLTVTALQDADTADESAVLTLTSGYSARVGSPNSATVTIQQTAIWPYVYVVPPATPGASPVSPYDTWAKAATNIQTAVDYACTNMPSVHTVIVSNGTYTLTAGIAITNAITVRSFGGGLGGASNTVVKGNTGTFTIFTISNPSAAVQGLTIRESGSASTGNGIVGGVWMNGGLVSDCIIVSNAATTLGKAGGVYMTGGTVSNCLVIGNATLQAGKSGGIYATGGLIIGCQITDNVPIFPTHDGNQWGGGVYMEGATLRNCLIARNRTRWLDATSLGGGVYLNSGVIENCTIVSNIVNTGGNGGGVHRVAGTVSSSIIYFNTVGGVHSNLNTTTGFGYCCATNPALSGNGNISADPQFKDLAAGDYRLLEASLCVDGGTNQAWMVGATDLAGNDRKVDGDKNGSVIVDMGAYEYQPPPQNPGTVFLLR